MRFLHPLLAAVASTFLLFSGMSACAADRLSGIDGYNDGTDSKDQAAPAMPKRDRTDKSQY